VFSVVPTAKVFVCMYQQTQANQHNCPCQATKESISVCTTCTIIVNVHSPDIATVRERKHKFSTQPVSIPDYSFLTTQVQTHNHNPPPQHTWICDQQTLVIISFSSSSCTSCSTLAVSGCHRYTLLPSPTASVLLAPQ
jgi:hypothetical protein